MSADQQGNQLDLSFYLGLVVILAVVGLIVYGATRPTSSADSGRSPSPVATIASESPTPMVEESTDTPSVSASAAAPTASAIGDRPTLSVNSALVVCEREVLNRTGVSVKSKYQTGIIGEERTDEHLFVKVTVDAKSGRDKAQMVMECWATGSDEDPRVVNVDVY